MNGGRLVPLINGVEPAWANLICSIAGFPENGIVAIDYGDKQVMEDIMAAGQMPVARGYGNITAEGCSITLLMSSVEAIRKASLTGRLQDIAPFTISVNFIPYTGGTLIRHKLKNCQFTENKVSTKQGDTKVEVPLPLIVSHIDWI